MPWPWPRLTRTIRTVTVARRMRRRRVAPPGFRSSRSESFELLALGCDSDWIHSFSRSDFSFTIGGPQLSRFFSLPFGFDSLERIRQVQPLQGFGFCEGARY